MTSVVTTTSVRRPTDPAVRGLPPADCYVGFDGEGGEFEIQSASTPRATATRLYADDAGVSFQEVSCKVAYLRFLTRQESFEHHAQDEMHSNWIAAHDPPLTLNADLKWATPDGTVVQVPAELDVVPDDWESDEDDPVWEFCKKDHPDAVRCWHLQFRPARTRGETR